jgi:hypothetical protein
MATPRRKLPAHVPDSSYEDFIEGLSILKESMILARDSIDLIGVDRLTFTHAEDLAADEYDELCAAIRQNRRSDALIAAAYLKELFDLAVYAAVAHLEGKDVNGIGREALLSGDPDTPEAV